MEGFENFDKYQYLISIIKKVDNKWDCLNSGASWKNQFLNFDDIFNSMTSLFVMSNSV
jgi:hypothetical protein